MIDMSLSKLPKDMEVFIRSKSLMNGNSIIINLEMFLKQSIVSTYNENKMKIKDWADDPSKTHINKKHVQSFVDWADVHIKNSSNILMFKEFCYEAIILYKIEKGLV